MITTMDALVSLMPGVQFTLIGEDIDNIVFQDSTQTAPTSKQIRDEINRLVKAQEAAAATAANNATAAVAHAKSLGFTDEMISVMYPNLGVSE